MDSQDHGIHSLKECVPEGSDYFQQTLGRRRSSTHNKRREDGSNWRSSSHHPRRYLKRWGIWRTQFLKNPLSILAFGWEMMMSWMKKMMKKKDQEGVCPRNEWKDKYSIVISWYSFVMHLIIFNWYVMHVRLFALMTVYY